MKKTISAIGIAAASLFALSAHAADGTITFNGEVTATTCTINGGTTDQTVTLPTVSTSALSAAGVTAGVSTRFDFELTDCTADVQAVARFENGATVNTDGNLTNMAAATPATNVAVQLLNSNFEPINIVSNSNNDAAAGDGVAIVTGGGGTVSYYSQYIATGGAAGAGLVNTTVEYSMQYE